MATKREYLVEKGLAKAGRGRFSKEAVAALAAAEAEGIVFDEPVKPEKPVKSETDEEPAPSSPSLPTEAQKVREWARAQGIEVGERGRIPKGVTAAYQGNPPPAKNVAVVKPWRIMRDYSLINGTTDDGLVVQFGDCQRCAKRVRYCECASGPVAPEGLTNLTPVR